MTQAWKPANAPASNFSLGNYVGQLLLFTIGGVHEDWPIGTTTAPTVRGNVVVVETGEEWTDVLMFAVKVVTQFRGDVGQVVLGRVVAEKGRGSNDMYSINPQLTPTDEQWANYWISTHPGRLEELQRVALLTYQAEEARRNGGSRTGQAAASAPPPPPPPPPAPAAPPPPPAAQPAYAPPAAPPYAGPEPPVRPGAGAYEAPPPPSQPVYGPPAGSPPPWTPPSAPPVPAGPPPLPNAHILGGPPQPGDTSTPPY